MMMIQILNCLIINHTELKVQNINMLSHQLHKFITADQLLELSNQYLIISKMITVRANYKVKRTCKSQKTILLQERTCTIKMITKRDTYPKAFKVAIRMIKVNKLDINHFHNTKTLKKWVRMKKMIFQATLNSKTKCKKRNNKVIISKVNHFGDNTIKDKLLQL